MRLIDLLPRDKFFIPTLPEAEEFKVLIKYSSQRIVVSKLASGERVELPGDIPVVRTWKGLQL